MVNLNELDKMVDPKGLVKFECDSHWWLSEYDDTTIFSSVRDTVQVPFSQLYINPTFIMDDLIVEVWRGHIATMGFDKGKYSLIKSGYGSLFRVDPNTYIFMEHKIWKESNPAEFKNIMEVFIDKGVREGEIIRPCFRKLLSVNLINNQSDEDWKNYDYHESEKIYIGESDSAQVLISGISADTHKLTRHMLNFGEDGSYYAYKIDQRVLKSKKLKWPCSNHYSKQFSFINLIYIVDADGLVCDLEIPEGMQLNIYRSGLRGCIFELEEI